MGRLRYEAEVGDFWWWIEEGWVVKHWLLNRLLSQGGVLECSLGGDELLK